MEEVAPGEVNNDPSMTQPNQVMTVREIIEKFTHGLPVDAGDPGFYDDPENFDASDFDSLDPFQKVEYLREQRSRIDSDLQWQERQAKQFYEAEQKKKREEAHSINSSAASPQESAEGDKPKKSDGNSQAQTKQS